MAMAPATYKLDRNRLDFHQKVPQRLTNHRTDTQKTTSKGKVPSPREVVEAKVAANSEVMFSESCCQYCAKTKALLRELGVQFEPIELDQVDDGDAIQDALAEITGSKLPNVFIGGKSVGGNSDIQALHKNGQFVPLLKQHGALP
ncbi:Glutaredoxin, partial [Globisporangium splendens]